MRTVRWLQLCNYLLKVSRLSHLKQTIRLVTLATTKHPIHEFCYFWTNFAHYLLLSGNQSMTLSTVELTTRTWTTANLIGVMGYVKTLNKLDDRHFRRNGRLVQRVHRLDCDTPVACLEQTHPQYRSQKWFSFCTFSVMNTEHPFTCPSVF